MFYEFNCPTHKKYTRKKSMKNPSNELREDKCPECGKISKRVYSLMGSFFQGMQAPNFERDVQAIRFRNNKKSKGEGYAMDVERRFEKSRSAG